MQVYTYSLYSLCQPNYVYIFVALPYLKVSILAILFIFVIYKDTLALSCVSLFQNL